MTKRSHTSPVSTIDRAASEELVREPSADEIAQRAYQLFEARGRDAGSDLDDWLEAERELHAANGREHR